MTASARPPSPSQRREPQWTDAALDDLSLGPGELDRLVDALAPPPSSDPAPGRARLLDALETTHRFDDLEHEVARLLDIDLAQARRLLLEVDRESVWSPGPRPSCKLFHVDGGERVRGAVTGFLKVEPGGGFPLHEHLGDEIVLVLQGACRVDGGRVVPAGETDRMPAGSAHAFVAEGDLPLVLLAIVDRGLVIDGAEVLPGDPRF